MKSKILLETLKNFEFVPPKPCSCLVMLYDHQTNEKTEWINGGKAFNAMTLAIKNTERMETNSR